MKTITINTAELSGAALDWAVAKAVGRDVTFGHWGSLHYGAIIRQPVDLFPDQTVPFKPSTDWSQGGPLIEEYFVDTTFERPGLIYASLCESDNPDTDLIPGMFGGSYLIASCRAIVAAKLGVAVDVPADMVEPNK